MHTTNPSKNTDDDKCHREVNSTIKRCCANATLNQSKSNGHNHHHRIPAVFKLLRQPRLKEAIRRDVVFLLAGALAACIVGYIETHASDDEIRFRDVVNRSGSGTSLSSSSSTPSIENTVCVANRDDSCCCSTNMMMTMMMQQQQQHHSSTTQNSMRILDAGFILTTPIYTYLATHRHVNDYLAMGNSILLTLPFLYCIYVTLWKGDFRLSFRLIATHLFRSLCGWFTWVFIDIENESSCTLPILYLCVASCQSKVTHHSQNVWFSLSS